ncbi:hypothetical protein [Saccharothrix sp. HUAS TT1]|uniref:hypothetical protein n=1 Tax=unclassified Saccharothrix TaxID=2593673 RepID=UPI00345BC6B6
MNQGTPGRPSSYETDGSEHRSEVTTGREFDERVTQEPSQTLGPFNPVVASLLSPGLDGGLLDSRVSQQGGTMLKRSAPPQPRVDYLSIPHRELYESVNIDANPGVVGENSDVWTKLGNKLVEFEDVIARAITASESYWTGDAGDRGRQAMAEIGRRSAGMGAAAQVAGTLSAQQSDALTTAKSNVPLPPAEPFNVEAANRRLMTITDPIAYAMQAEADRAEFTKQRREHMEAALAVEAYDRTVAQTAAAQPAFAPPPVVPPPPPPPPPPMPPPPDQPPVRPQPGRPGQPFGTAPGERAVVPPVVGGTTGVASVGPGDGGSGGTGGTTGTSGTGSGTYTPSGGRDGHVGGTGVGGRDALGVPGPGGLGGTGAGRNGRGGGGFGRGVGGVGGVGGAAGGGGRVPGGGLPGGGLPGSGLAGGAGSAAKGWAAGGAHGEAGARGGGRAGVGAGMPGMGPMGGPAAGRGEEDVEHQSPSYLLEPDAEALFGNDEATAPPVIGDWSGH